MPGPLSVLFGATAVNAPHAPIVTTVINAPKTAVSERFPSNSHSVSYMLLITIETFINAIVFGKLVRRPSLIKPKPSGIKKRDELKSLCNPYHVTSVYYSTVAYILFINVFS